MAKKKSELLTQEQREALALIAGDSGQAAEDRTAAAAALEADTLQRVVPEEVAA